MRGSRYERKFDYQGKPTNDEEIAQILKKGVSDLTGIAPAQSN